MPLCGQRAVRAYSCTGVSRKCPQKSSLMQDWGPGTGLPDSRAAGSCTHLHCNHDRKEPSPRSRGPKEGVAYNFCFISHSVLPVEDCWMKGGTPGSWKAQAEHRCGSWGHHCKVLRERKLPPWILWKHPYGMKRKERWSRMKKNRNFWQQPFAGKE